MQNFSSTCVGGPVALNATDVLVKQQNKIIMLRTHVHKLIDIITGQQIDYKEERDGPFPRSSVHGGTTCYLKFVHSYTTICRP